jgi:hypothetical protein
MSDAHANLAYSILTSSPGHAGNVLTVTAGTGAIFPAVPFNCTVWPASVIPTSTNAEIVRVTNVVGDSFAITRAQEGTSAKNLLVGFQIANTITAKVITDIELHLPSVGVGSPEGVVTRGPGTPYLDTATNSLWIKLSGSGNTGWLQLIA